MPFSTRFPVALHILVALDWNSDGYFSSERLAFTVDTNAVVVRRVLGRLREAGLVETQAGAHGGARLARVPEQVSLLEVYRAVEEGDLFPVHAPNAGCGLGACITDVIAPVYAEAEEALEAVLARTTVADLSERAHAAQPAS